MEKTKIRKPYVQLNWTIGANNIGRFVRPEWHREFRESHINSIKSGLEHGIHPSEVVTINEVGDDLRVINGNHRIEAIRRIIKENKGFSIELTLCTYRDLPVEQEIKKYEIINNTRRETGLDKLKAKLFDSYIYRKTTGNKDFPIRILYRNRAVGDRNAVTAVAFFNSYAARLTTNFSFNAVTIATTARNWDEKDFDRLEAFARTIRAIIGEPSKQNHMATFNFFSAIGKLYFNNVGVTMTQSEFIARCKQWCDRNVTEILLYKEGFENIPKIYSSLIAALSARGRKVIDVVKTPPKAE